MVSIVQGVWGEIMTRLGLSRRAVTLSSTGGEEEALMVFKSIRVGKMRVMPLLVLAA